MNAYLLASIIVWSAILAAAFFNHDVITWEWRDFFMLGIVILMLSGAIHLAYQSLCIR